MLFLNAFEAFKLLNMQASKVWSAPSGFIEVPKCFYKSLAVYLSHCSPGFCPNTHFYARSLSVTHEVKNNALVHAQSASAPRARAETPSSE